MVKGIVAICAAIETVVISQTLANNLFGTNTRVERGFCNSTMPTTATYDNWNPMANKLFGLISNRRKADAAMEFNAKPLRWIISPKRIIEIIKAERMIEGDNPVIKA